MFKPISISFLAIVAIVFAMLRLNARAVNDAPGRDYPNSDTSLQVSFEPMRAFDEESRTFAATNYRIQSTGISNCSVILPAKQFPVVALDSLAVDGDVRIWTGNAKEFLASGFPDPCP